MAAPVTFTPATAVPLVASVRLSRPENKGLGEPLQKSLLKTQQNLVQ
jgi:hypothetical protein